jgi:hypothetical protein
MRRPIIYAVLSFLLLFMQQEAQVHALSHLGPQLARSHQTEVLAPLADEACVECSLLAAGTIGAAGEQALLAPAGPVAELIWSAYRSRAADVPSFFSSRAPPVLL